MPRQAMQLALSLAIDLQRSDSVPDKRTSMALIEAMAAQTKSEKDVLHPQRATNPQDLGVSLLG